MKYFKDDEFQCKCGCGLDVNNIIKQIFDNARELAGVPFVVNSGARCHEHNRTVGSRSTSSHVKGLAVDIKCNIETRFRIESAVRKFGVTRIGHNFEDNFIHFDIDETKPQQRIFGY